MSVGVSAASVGRALGDTPGRRALIVDLNNFATFPTLAVGLLVAGLRGAGFKVSVLSPLDHGVPAAEREHAETFRDHLARRVHLSSWGPLAPARDAAREVRDWWNNRPDRRVLREVERALAAHPDVLLLSAYLQHHATAAEIGRLAQRARVPLLVGGPMFTQPEAADSWLRIPGLTALVSAEADLSIGALASAACGGGDLLAFPGVTLPDGRGSSAPRPLRDLDATPTPDFTDFPWARYRVRIVPLMATRGCQWGNCTFCSDVVSASGRSYRNRSADHVLAEMREQSQRHHTKNFLFLDLKLNSNPELFRAIVGNVQSQIEGARWISTVHVDDRRDNGLSRPDLQAAYAAGMRRISFGLETGSQRLLDAMRKGSHVERNAEFIRDAREAGLSVRCTMFRGFPGETAHDLELTADFLERHAPNIDRIRFNEFSAPMGTPIYRELMSEPPRFADLRVTGLDPARARARYVTPRGRDAAYRKAMSRVLRAVHEVNRRPIRSDTPEFDGLM